MDATIDLLCATNSTLAEIEVWEGEAGDCTIYHDTNTIIINVAGTYGFRAWNGNPESPVLQDIQNITVDSGVTGDVNVKVAYDSDGENGAVNLRRADLTGGSGDGNLAHLYIFANLATTNNVVCDNLATDGNVECATITGNITVNGDMATGGDVDCDNLVGDITVGGTHGDGPGSITYDLRADTGTGDIGIAGDCVGDLSLGTYNTAEITIGGLLLGDLDAGEPHDVTIAGTGEHTGDISFIGDGVGNDYFKYDLKIGDPNDPNSIMRGDIYIRYGTQGWGGGAGWIRINGKMYGSSRLFGLC